MRACACACACVSEERKEGSEIFRGGRGSISPPYLEGKERAFKERELLRRDPAFLLGVHIVKRQEWEVSRQASRRAPIRALDPCAQIKHLRGAQLEEVL